MNATTVLATILAGAIAFAIAGAVIGGAIGTVAPGYYRSVFHHGDAPNFNPFQVGIGLGATQGVASGAVIAAAVVALLAWRDGRVARPARETTSQAGVPGRRSWTVHALWSVVTTIAVLVVGAVTFVLGALIGQQQLYQAWTERKLDKLAAILRESDFAGVQAGYSSAAQVFLTGMLKDDAARASLHDKLTVTFGAEEAADMIRQVEVAP